MNIRSFLFFQFVLSFWVMFEYRAGEQENGVEEGLFLCFSGCFPTMFDCVRLFTYLSFVVWQAASDIFLSCIVIIFPRPFLMFCLDYLH